MYKTPDEIQVKIDEYFSRAEEDVYTMIGLALYLGFHTRQSLIDYEKKEEFIVPIGRARMRVEEFNAISLHKGNVAGAKFTLINNFGWKEKVETPTTNTNINYSKLKSVDQMTDQELEDELAEIKERAPAVKRFLFGF